MFNAIPAVLSASPAAPVYPGLPVGSQVIGHWDASLGVIHSAGSVSSWEDQSGNNRHWTSVTNPSRVASTLNGLPVISFDGIDDLMSQAAFLSGTTVSAEIMYVCRRNTTSDKGWHAFGSSSAQSHMVYANRMYETFGATTRTPEFATIDTGNLVWAVVNTSKVGSGGALQVRINNIQRRTDNLASGWNGTFYLGSGSPVGTVFGSNSWNGQIAEFAMWDRILISQERTTLFNFFKTKYALSI